MRSFLGCRITQGEIQHGQATEELGKGDSLTNPTKRKDTRNIKAKMDVSSRPTRWREKYDE